MHDDLHLTIRNLTNDDYDEIKVLMDKVYHDLGGSWPEHTIHKLIKDFPEGQICLEDYGKIVGLALSVQVRYQSFSNTHTYDDLSDQ